MFGRVQEDARRHDLLDYLRTMPLIVGVSGGADSLAMLHLLNSIRGNDAAATLHVAHLNHWVRGKEAHEDADFVRSIALNWGLTCTIERFDVPNYARRHKLSPEDAARRARYAFFASLAQKHNAAIAVAHNADDQVETVLMSILRGTGLRGLAGMQMLAQTHLPERDESLEKFVRYEPDRVIKLFRPLLGIWRWQILDYCKEMELEPRWDSTNWEPKYKRNRVRHDLLPMLQIQYSLAIKEHLYNLSQIAQEEDAWLSAETYEMLEEVARSLVPNKEISFVSIDFAALSRGAQRRVIREALFTVAGTERDFTFKQIEAAVAVISGTVNSPRAMQLPHGILVDRDGSISYVRRREVEKIELREEIERPLVEQGWQIELKPQTSLSTKTGWRVETVVVSEAWIDPDELKLGAFSAIFDMEELSSLGPLEWRTRRIGDQMHPFGMSGSKSLQDIMVDAKIPKEQRENIPVLAARNSADILWIPGEGGRRSAYAPVSTKSRRIMLIQWVRDSER